MGAFHLVWTKLFDILVDLSPTVSEGQGIWVLQAQSLPCYILLRCHDVTPRTLCVQNTRCPVLQKINGLEDGEQLIPDQNMYRRNDWLLTLLSLFCTDDGFFFPPTMIFSLSCVATSFRLAPVSLWPSPTLERCGTVKDIKLRIH